jgi:TRAP-type C4-dicarboxylate transport system permease small subunit
MRKALNWLFAASGHLAGAAVLAIFVLMIGGSVGRIFGWRVGAVNDLVSWLCAAAAFLAMAYSFKNGDFVRVTLLLEKLSPPKRRFFEVLSLSIAAIAIGYLAFWAARFTWESYKFEDMASGMVAIPIWIPQTSFVVGAVLFWLAVLDELVLVLQGETPTYVRLVAERHAQGDFSADL